MTNRVAVKGGKPAVFVSRYAVPAMTALAEELSRIADADAKASDTVDEDCGDQVTIKVEWSSP